MNELECNHQCLKFGSLSRIADLRENPFIIRAVPRKEWDGGDYVVGRYLGSKSSNNIDCLELCDGTLHTLQNNDVVVGALGERCATQEVVGTWKLIDHSPHPVMHHICGSGMFGIETSRSGRHKLETGTFQYEGHCLRQGKKVCMKDFAPKNVAKAMPNCPIVLIVGSSMSCGKTVTGKIIIDIIKHDLGLNKAIGAKFTGGGYRHDTNEMLEAGASNAIDFVDVGYSSTVMPRKDYRELALPTMLGLLSEFEADCIVAELGASPLEPYNGVEVLKELAGYPKLFLVLCATDAYAALGLCSALKAESLDFQPDVVCGMAANNSAGIALIEKLTGLPALNLEGGPDSYELQKLLKKRFVN